MRKKTRSTDGFSDIDRSTTQCGEKQALPPTASPQNARPPGTIDLQLTLRSSLLAYLFLLHDDYLREGTWSSTSWHMWRTHGDSRKNNGSPLNATPLCPPVT